MILLTDLLPGKGEIRPTRPTCENPVGRPQSLMYVSASDTSDTSDTKNALETFPEENGLQQTTFAQVLYENPESVRHLPLADDDAHIQAADGNRWEAHWRACCPDYWRGCWTCPDADLTKRVFCKRHPRPSWAEALQGA